MSAQSKQAIGAAHLEGLLSGKAPLIAADDLRAGYGGTEILHGVNLRLHRGGWTTCFAS